MRTNPYEGGSDHSVFLAAGVPSVLAGTFLVLSSTPCLGEALQEVLDLPLAGAEPALRAAVDRAIERLHLQQP